MRLKEKQKCTAIVTVNSLVFSETYFSVARNFKTIKALALTTLKIIIGLHSFLVNDFFILMADAGRNTPRRDHRCIELRTSTQQKILN